MAIAKAEERTVENGRTARNRYRQSDIFSYVPDRQFDVILFRDSIYYVPHRQINAMLQRYAQYLEADAVFIVRMADGDKYRDIVETIETHFVVVDRHVADDPKAIVLVFRPHR